MAGFRLNTAADRRLADIDRYSLLNFGSSQARAYVGSLHEAFERIGALPAIGQAVTGVPT